MSRREELLKELAQIDAAALAEAAKNEPAQHNHDWDYTEGYLDLGACPRCDFLRAEKQAMGDTPHNHEKMPFGRSVAGCPRCAELAKGAKARPGFKNRRWR